MDDIVKRLRDWVGSLERLADGWSPAAANVPMYREAADEIERLRRELADAKGEGADG